MVLVPVGAAEAHAELLGTSPRADSVVGQARVVVLRFDEAVTVAPDSSAICTSGEPVSPVEVAYSAMIFFLVSASVPIDT